MYGFSTVDGFMSVNEELQDMIKYLANEPSVGLYYVQQHAHNTMPNLLNVRDKVAERTRETVLHTEDLEDSIVAVNSMTEFGLPIADGMIKDINRSLNIMSKSTPQRGLIQSSSWGSQIGKGGLKSTSSSHSLGSTLQDGIDRQSYFSTVLKSAKQKAESLRWSSLSSTSHSHAAENSTLPIPFTAPVPITSSGLTDAEAEELPISSFNDTSGQVEWQGALGSSSIQDGSENFEKFQFEREAKLQKWLQETDECPEQEARH